MFEFVQLLLLFPHVDVVYIQRASIIWFVASSGVVMQVPKQGDFMSRTRNTYNVKLFWYVLRPLLPLFFSFRVLTL